MRDFDLRITLTKVLSVTPGVTGNPTQTTEDNTYWAGEEEIFSSEQNNANKDGIKLEKAYTIRRENYSGQEFATVDGIKYEIYKVRDGRNKDFVKLLLAREKGKSNVTP